MPYSKRTRRQRRQANTSAPTRVRPSNFVAVHPRNIKTQLAARIEMWQGWLLPPGEPVRGTPVTLKIWIAGQSDPVEVGLYQDDGKFAALLPSSTWLSLSQAQYRDLMRPIP